ncbi:MAG: amidohydrolase family protein [Candidatus Binatia bacterium]
MSDAVQLLARDAPVLRVRGALALADATRAGAGEIRDVAILAENGIITAIGPAADPATRHPDAVEIGGDDYWVIPGLVNAHTHGRGVSWFRLGAFDDSLEPWIYALQGQPCLDPYLDTVYQNLRLLESGVTTVLHSHYARDPSDPEELDATLRAYVDAGLRVGFAVSLFTRNFFSYDDARFLPGLPAELRQRLQRLLGASDAPLDAEPVFAGIRRLAARHHSDRNGLPSVRILHGPVAPQWVTPEELQRCRREADEIGGGVHMHLLETAYQRADARRAFGESWGIRLDRLGVLGANVSVAHAVWIDDDELACLAERGVTVCHNPSSNLRLKNGIAPVARMRARGVRVALGGDNSILGGEEDLLAEMRLCANLHRQPGFEGAVLSAQDVLTMATTAGAAATGFGDRIGRLRSGAAADIVLLRHTGFTTPWVAPGLTAASVLLHAASARDVETVIVGGRVLYHAGRHRRFDKREIEAALAEQLHVAGAKSNPEIAALYRDLIPHRNRFEGRLFPDPAHYRYNVPAGA